MNSQNHVLGRYFWHRLEHSNPWQTKKKKKKMPEGAGRHGHHLIVVTTRFISASVSLTTHGFFMVITQEDVDCLSFDLRNKTLWGLHAGLVGCQMSILCSSCMSYYTPEMFAFDQDVILQQATVWQKMPENFYYASTNTITATCSTENKGFLAILFLLFWENKLY